MRALSAAELLDVWEIGAGQPAVERMLTLLAAACPELPRAALAQLSIGQRDAYLLTLREWTFGPQLRGLATCPACGERLELTFTVAEIRVAPPQPTEGPLTLNVAGYEVQFRLPNSADLLTLEAPPGPTATNRLLERCLLDVQHGGEVASAATLPAEVSEAVVAAMAQADPQADVRLALTCPACGHAWQALFDIAAFFWQEINTWAQRLLREVHRLASAYGWREADILALSPHRRQAYLELLSR